MSERLRALTFGMPVVGLLAVAMTACSFGSLGSDPTRPDAYRVVVPLGLDLVAPVPEDNALSEAKIALGRKLFFDDELSADRTMSCSSCHQPEHYFTDGRTRPLGVDGRERPRNVPTILNAAYGRAFFWDGRASSLEEQVLMPFGRELGIPADELVVRLGDRHDYREAFRKAFGDEVISPRLVSHALATYVRSLRSGDAPFDRFLNGDPGAISTDAKRGFRLFVGRANCGVCHLPPLFTDHQFHNTGVSWGSDDVGRFSVTGQKVDSGKFKTPSLRNVAMTAPYMHDGSIATLEEVLEHYVGGGVSNPNLDEEIKPLELTTDERRQLIAFLESLTSSPPIAAPSDGR